MHYRCGDLFAFKCGRVYVAPFAAHLSSLGVFPSLCFLSPSFPVLPGRYVTYTAKKQHYGQGSRKFFIHCLGEIHGNPAVHRLRPKNRLRTGTPTQKQIKKKRDRKTDTTSLLPFSHYFLVCFYLVRSSDSHHSKMRATAALRALQAHHGVVKPMLEYSSGSKTGQRAPQDVILRRHLSAWRLLL